MKAIGGYPEIELRKGEHYHKNAIRLNTARNCLEYILLAREYSKVYLPYYTCEAVFEPFRKAITGFPQMSFYHIDWNLDPVELPQLKAGEAFLYTNYFGLKQDIVGKLAEKYGNRLIVDNSQAFFDMPCHGIDTFYSVRKFFGVPDGAYLYTDAKMDCCYYPEIEDDESYNRMSALLKRIDISPEAGYEDFRRIEDSLCYQPIKRMSKLTEAILSSIDYDGIREIRRRNYLTLYWRLFQKNDFWIKLDHHAVPLCYPFFASSLDVRKWLAEKRLFVPTYWPNVLECCAKNTIEYDYAAKLLPLPIDQRYDDNDMRHTAQMILKILG